MRKFINIFVILTILLSFVACKKQKPVLDTPQQVNPENFISTNAEDMFVNYGKDYVWYEATVIFKDSLSDEHTSFEVETINNVFQTIDLHNPKVIIFESKDNVCNKYTIDGFWTECLPLKFEEIRLTFQDAYNKLMATNIPKPHSRFVVLRKELGSKDCNPQYIFGNQEAQVYVDALTGNVTDINPAF